ncbi:hypothetical protein [Acidovorax sp. JHL-9]|uniref:hypothetical protein n=1 Tax=Acidovorax sp. JHL-9 TaxID=1276756 RepID=UPI0012DCC4F4|nr:hypothetical protein [Acidovorax sp. JHL-9]
MKEDDMMALLRRTAVGLWIVFAAIGVTWAEDIAATVEPPVVKAQEPEAFLVVLNISGPTLLASNQDITDNGKELVSLPRSTYKRLSIAPGPHEFRFKPFPSGKRVAHLEAQANNTYYLVVGYSPGKSWAFPLGGDPMTIKVVSEEDATPLMKEMMAQ